MDWNFSQKQIDPKDYKYVVKDPKGFSVERNKAIIEETIRDTDKFFKSLEKDHDQGLGERIEAVSAYGAYRFNRGFMPIKKYLGDKEYHKLVGERILSKIRVMDTVNKLKGNTGKFEKSILL